MHRTHIAFSQIPHIQEKTKQCNILVKNYYEGNDFRNYTKITEKVPWMVGMITFNTSHHLL
jgi:hypothetical protein